MIARKPLNRFPLLRTGDIDEMRAVLGRVFARPATQVDSLGGSIDAVLHNHQLKDAGLSYLSYGAPVRVSIPEADIFSQIFLIRGSREFSVGRNVVSANLEKEQAVVSSPGMSITAKLSADYEQVSLRIDSGALARKLTAISGMPVTSTLKMEPLQDLARPEARGLRDLFLFVVNEVNVAETPMSRLILAEWEQALIVGFLHGNRHSHSHLLERAAPSLAPRQVRRVEEYIEANWNKPIQLEDIAEIAGSSARSIFRAFRQNRGYSPMAFVKSLRLRHSQRLLRSSGTADTVASVALSCGFNDPGRFSRDYRRAFGELPSATLKRVQGARPLVQGLSHVL